MNSLVWFRRDLRVHDNKALHSAAASVGSGGHVVGLFVITPKQWKQHDDADVKVAFWMENLRCLSAELQKLNIPLRIEVCDAFAEVPDVIESVCKSFDCGDVFFNREYEVNEVARDDAVIERCRSLSIEVSRFHDRVVVPPREIKTKQENFYSVFTPYRKVWDRKAEDFAKVLPKPKKQAQGDIESSSVPDQIDGFDLQAGRPDLYPAGEAEADKRLKAFAKRIDGYNENRDLPAVEGTSSLSAYLAAGVVSPRQCLALAQKAIKASEGENEGATVWVSELTWRDFYAHVLVGFPRVSKHLPFKEKTNGIDWRANQDDFEAWKEGRTGYPIVDAGMRQLNQTGWMHNRLRMVTAMFLTKNLLIDWRLGERYFMQKLIDGDLAANNGGWQWSASTGTDSVPYFRIFNPFSQSKRFDSDGEFIKQMCPELEPIPAKALHDIKKLSAAIQKYDVDYPDFVVDYSEGRQRALAAFKSL
jgi:deoxyribodipyrimidine photo-lyase